MSPAEKQVPPAGEEIHLPGLSAQPLLISIGITVALVGLTVNVIILIVGLLLTFFVMGQWIVEARREFESLPAEHHH
jgi:hypothetical protein